MDHEAGCDEAGHDEVDRDKAGRDEAGLQTVRRRLSAAKNYNVGVCKTTMPAGDLQRPEEQENNKKDQRAC